MVHRPLMSKSSQNFWDFSLQLYSVDGVAPACLELQNNHGLDVNMLLLCVWYGRHFGSLPSASLQQALEFSGHWRSNVVQPLRDTRQWMKGHPPPGEAEQASFSGVREQIKVVELKAEKHQQNTLQEIVSKAAIGKGETGNEANGVEAIQGNIKTMLGKLHITESENLNATLSVVTLAAIALQQDC